MTLANDDFASSVETKGRVSVGGSVAGAFENPYDSDWFKVHLEAGKNYLFGTTTKVGSLGLFDASGQSIYLPTTTSYDPTSVMKLSYRPLTSGDYYFAVSGSYSPGTYTAFVNNIALDDYSAPDHTAGILTPGLTLPGNLESSNDVDQFTLTVAAGSLYRLTLKETLTPYATQSHTTYFSASLPSGQTNSAFPFASGATSTLAFAPQSSGSATITVGYSSDPGAYTLNVEQVADDFASNTSTTGSIVVNGATAGSLDIAGDSDWFKIHLNPATTYSFSVTELGQSYIGSGLLLYDASGTLVPEIDTNSVSRNLIFSPTAEGDYYVAVKGYGEKGGNYVLAAAPFKDDISNAPNTFPTLSALGEVAGKIDYRGDHDRIKLSVAAGNYYTLSLTASSPDGGTLYYSPAVSITRPDGTTTGNFGVSQIVFKAETAGTYILDVNSSYGEQINYTLKSVSVISDDAANSSNGATVFALDTPVSGKLEVGSDQDYYKIHLARGETYQLTFDGGDSNAFAGLLAPSGASPLFGKNGSWAFAAPTDGDYYAYVRADGSTTGNYNLRLSAIHDAISANAGTSGRLQVGATTQATLDNAGDIDWFAVSLDAGKTYSFSVGLPANSHYPQPQIVDAGGGVLESNYFRTSATSVVLAFTPQTTGIYYFSMSEPGSTYAYTVAAAIDPPDDHGNDLQHATTIKPDQLVQGVFSTNWDVDALRIHLQANQYYAVTASATDAQGRKLLVGQGWMSALDATNGTLLWQVGLPFKSYVDGDFGEIFKPAEFANLSHYSIVFTSLGTDDYGDTNASATRSSIGVMSGILEIGGDCDVIVVHLQKNGAYSVDLHDLPTSANGHGVTLSMQDAGGRQLASISAQTEAGTKAIFAAPEEGDYYFAVRSLNYQSGDPYLLRITRNDSDHQAPVVSKLAPSAAAITIDFSETILRDAGTIRLLDAGGHTTASYDALSDKHLSMHGATLTLALTAQAPLYPGTTYSLELGAGSLSDESANQVAAASLSFTTAAPAAATARDDLLTASANGGHIDGNAGVDTVYYQGAAADYQVKRDQAGSHVSLAGGATVDTLVNVERLLFTSGDAIALDVEGTGGDAYRLYQAAFNRAPDKAGTGFWISAMDKGMSLHDVAQSFVDSAEFRTTYGTNLSDARFVDQLYSNVLHRAGDADGIVYWNRALSGGVARADMLAAFSESAENHSATAVVIGNGFVYTPFWQ